MDALQNDTCFFRTDSDTKVNITGSSNFALAAGVENGYDLSVLFDVIAGTAEYIPKTENR